jgi:twitching motility protein PilT
MQRGALGFALRTIKTEVPPLSGKLNLPEVISRLTYLPRGLVLVTGDTGSGKTTTLAAMIQAMNQRYRKHIITLEDPVEYVVRERQVGDRAARAGRGHADVRVGPEARAASGPGHHPRR